MKNLVSFLAVIAMSVGLVVTGFFAGVGYQDSNITDTTVPACTVPQHVSRDISDQYPGVVIRFIPVVRDDQLLLINVEVHPDTPQEIRDDIINRYRIIGVDAVITDYQPIVTPPISEEKDASTTGNKMSLSQ